MSYYPQNTPPVKPHQQTQLVYVTQQPQPSQTVVLVPAQTVQQTPPPQQQPYYPPEQYQEPQYEYQYQEPQYEPMPEPPLPPPPVIIEQPVYVNPTPSDWSREHKAWKSAKGCYLCALLTALLLMLGLGCIWPTILVSRAIGRLDHTLHLERSRMLNDNITFYQEANLNDARLCAARTGEREWGDRLNDNINNLETTVGRLRDEKDSFDKRYGDNGMSGTFNELQRAEQQAASVCGARTSVDAGATTIGSTRYQVLRDNLRGVVAADSVDTDKMFWEQETHLIDAHWMLWLAIYITVGVVGTALAFLAAAYANLTTAAHKCWDAGAFGNNPNTTKVGAQQKICVFITFFVFVAAALTCYSLEASGQQHIKYEQSIYEYGHQLNNVRLYDEQLSAAARLCTGSSAGLGYKEKFTMASKGMAESLTYLEILNMRITHDYGNKWGNWENNWRIINNMKAANSNMLDIETRAIAQCTDGTGSSADRDRMFSSEYDNEKTIMEDSMRRLSYNLNNAMDDNRSWGNNVIRHAYRGATIALTVLFAIVALLFFMFMAKLVNQRWQSKMPGARVF